VSTEAVEAGVGLAVFEGFPPEWSGSSVIFADVALAVFTGHQPSMGIVAGTAQVLFTGFRPKVSVH
jgi:hypothetical protein